MTMQHDFSAPKLAKDYIPATGYSEHSVKDARSLALHSVIAAKVNRDPGLLGLAREYQAARQAGHGPGRVPGYEAEWEQILTLPWPQIAAFLIAVTEDAIRLRASSPFVGILTEAERERIFAAFRP